MRNRFDRELLQMDRLLIHMGELCEEAIGDVTRAIEKHDTKIAKAVIEADEEIDQMEKDIERLCLRLLLQQQPVAKDLRRISAALKMITDMERIGDQTADIAEIVISSGVPEPVLIEEITQMSSEVSKMVIDSVTAYVQKDMRLAEAVQEADDSVDRHFDTISNRLIEYIRQEKGEHGKYSIDLLMIAKYLERIGDHATNISEWVEFSITGVHRNENIPD